MLQYFSWKQKTKIQLHFISNIHFGYSTNYTQLCNYMSTNSQDYPRSYLTDILSNQSQFILFSVLAS